MEILISGLLIFLFTHLIPWKPELRTRFVARIGEIGYKAVFSLISLLGLGLIIHGYAGADYTHLWDTPAVGRAVAFGAIPIAGILIAAAYVGSNLKRVTAHPMLWGVAIWAAVHLINNGDVASAILFGGILAYSLSAMVSANRRGAKPTAVRAAVWRDGLAILIGIGATLIVARYHQGLFGVAVIG